MKNHYYSWYIKFYHSGTTHSNFDFDGSIFSIKFIPLLLYIHFKRTLCHYSIHIGTIDINGILIIGLILLSL